MSQAWLTPPNTDGMASMAFFLNDRVTRKKHEACPLPSSAFVWLACFMSCKFNCHCISSSEHFQILWKENLKSKIVKYIFENVCVLLGYAPDSSQQSPD